MNISQATYQKLSYTWWTLKLTYGLLFVVAGADKFLDLVVHWQKYLNPRIPAMFGMDGTVCMYAIGIIEIIIGIITLSNWTKLGALLIAGWFSMIVINLLLMMTYFDIAVRDTVLAIGALVLRCLTVIKEEIEKAS